MALISYELAIISLTLFNSLLRVGYHKSLSLSMPQEQRIAQALVCLLDGILVVANMTLSSGSSYIILCDVRCL